MGVGGRWRRRRRSRRRRRWRCRRMERVSKRKRSWCRSRSVESEDRVSGSVAATACDGGLKVPRRVSQIAGPSEGQHHSE